jgi:hypothetical protein
MCSLNKNKKVTATNKKNVDDLKEGQKRLP